MSYREKVTDLRRDCMKKIRYFLFLFVFIGVLCGCGNKETSKLDPDNPVTVKVWHYYNGDKKEIFDKYVKEFNETEGAQKGVNVEVTYLGSTYDIQDEVLAAANKEIGAESLPNIFAAYSDNAYEIDKLGLLADISQYISDEEKAEFVEGYINEGYQFDNKSLKIFPIVKSTEVMYLNRTDWDEFASATGAKESDLLYVEGITDVAKEYYEWSGGKALFGRDAVANLFNIAFKQFGKEMFNINGDKVELEFDREIVKKIWDNLYVPLVQGYFYSDNSFRSDNMKLGSIIAYVGSSSSVEYLPKEVTINDSESYPIEISVLEAPVFKDGEQCAVQQGAGMAVIDSDEKEVEASVCFLKWLTQTERNAKMAVELGYLPVKKEANNIEYMRDIIKDYDISETVKESLYTGIQIANEKKLYTSPVFENASDVRQILEKSMLNKALADRELILAGDDIDKYLTDDNFDEWYNEVTNDINEFIK